MRPECRHWTYSYSQVECGLSTKYCISPKKILRAKHCSLFCLLPPDDDKEKSFITLIHRACTIKHYGFIMYRFRYKQVCLSKLVCFATGNRKDPSLLRILSICPQITNLLCFIVQASGVIAIIRYAAKV